jgi:hypothetical protein
VTGDREERNRVLGFPVDNHPNTRPRGSARGGRPRRRPDAEEPQRVLGIPADWLDQLADDVLRPLLRRIRGTRGRG